MDNIDVEIKLVGYADGTEFNPDGTRMCQGSEIFLYKGEIWEGYRLLEMGVIPCPDGVGYHPVEGWFSL